MEMWNNSYPPGVIVRPNVYASLENMTSSACEQMQERFRDIKENLWMQKYQDISLVIEQNQNPRCNLSFQPFMNIETSGYSNTFSYNKPQILSGLKTEWILYLYEEHIPEYSRVFFDKNQKPFHNPSLNEQVGLENLIKVVRIERERLYIFSKFIYFITVLTITNDKLQIHEIKLIRFSQEDLIYASTLILNIEKRKGRFEIPLEFNMFEQSILHTCDIRDEIF